MLPRLSAKTNLIPGLFISSAIVTVITLCERLRTPGSSQSRNWWPFALWLSRPLRRIRSGQCTLVDSTPTILLSTTRRGSTAAFPREQFREASYSVAHRSKLQGHTMTVIKGCLLVAAVVAATATITAAAESARAQTAPTANDGKCAGNTSTPWDAQIVACTDAIS